MIIDQALQLSSAQAITASAASTSYIDQTVRGDAYDSLFMVFRVGTAFTTGTAGTLTIGIQTADDAAFTTNLTTLQSSGTFAVAALTANTEIFKTRLPAGTRRYVRAYYTVANAFTAGTIDCNMSDDVQTYQLV